MFRSLSPHSRAILTALFVTFLWATSWVIIKFGLSDNIPPLTFAGMRYSIAALCLLPVVLRQPALRNSIREFSARQWQLLIALGLIFIGVAQGMQFISLSYLPAITVNLLLSFTAIVVTTLGIFFLSERPMPAQWLGLVLYLAGATLYFYPVTLSGSDFIGIIAALICLAANAVSTVLGRAINRTAAIAPILVTLITMIVGGVSMLIVGIILEPAPALSLSGILSILWLSAVNSAFAFTLYNGTLQTLTAIESNLINNMMLVFIPVLAWLFWGETITLKSLLALILATGGIFVVTLARWGNRLPSPRAFAQRKRGS